LRALESSKVGTPFLTMGPVKDEEVFRRDAEPNLSSRRASVQAPGSPEPGFVMPPGFQQRLGRQPRDFFYSGVFPSTGLRIGYIRIPTFFALSVGVESPDSEGIAQFASEIAYLEANTDGLVVDIMHNPGGSPPYGDKIYSYLSPQPYRQIQLAWRPTLLFLNQISSDLARAVAMGDDAAIAFYRTKLEQSQAAYRQGAELTPPFPLDGATLMRDPANTAYTKPIMLLTDDFSVSAADAFAAQFQDNQRGIIFGIRTNGAGGIGGPFPVGAYSQGTTSAELSLIVRNGAVNAPGYPPSPYVDSVGVQPDITADLLTKENLLNHGASFSQSMVAAITNYIQQQNHR
jgi:C-terminal processing protease CtpA/Prc